MLLVTMESQVYQVNPVKQDLRDLPHIQGVWGPTWHLDLMERRDHKAC